MTNEHFKRVLSRLLRPGSPAGCLPILDAAAQFDTETTDPHGVAQSMNAAFLLALAGDDDALTRHAREFLQRQLDSSQWGEVAHYYLDGIERIHSELAAVARQDPAFADRLQQLATWLAGDAAPDSRQDVAEHTWSVFFPEATGIVGHEQQRIAALRQRRTVKINSTNPDPITDPAAQLLVTSNVLLTVPGESPPIDQLPLSEDLQARLRDHAQDPQLYWYDHPIQIGVAPEANEILYGLRGLDAAVQFERDRGNWPNDARLTCVLSVSVTHRSLQSLAGQYLRETFAQSDTLDNLEIYAFSEADTQRIIQEVLAPAAERYLQRNDAATALAVFGVDGPYGRHYSFLKAVAAFWAVLIDPEIRATFKIDLDQVFPQQELVQQSGASAFEHFTTPLWGALGVDSDGQAIELGMLAGALVNERDIGTSIFTPDVRFPNREPSAEECFFFSGLPQALSTEAEMMTRYDTEGLDGTNACLQRIHVTGGTNGILIDSLRRHRPFTPSFIGRAEDQAYLLSVIGNTGERLAYLHEPGLIMRHDKEAFAQDAIAAAHVGKLIGDYERLLYFSTYASLLPGGVTGVKHAVDPFTGCFISSIPTTVAYLRFAMKAASFFTAGNAEDGADFMQLGARRIGQALEFVDGADSGLKGAYEDERSGWQLYYEILAAMEQALAGDDDFARQLCDQARAMATACAIQT